MCFVIALTFKKTLSWKITIWESFPKAYFQQQFEAWEIYFVYECWTVKLLFWLSILLFRVELFSLPFFIVFNSNPSHSTEMGSFSWLKDTVIVGLYQMSFIHIQSFYWGFWMKICMSVFIFYIIITPKRKLRNPWTKSPFWIKWFIRLNGALEQKTYMVFLL